MKAEIDFRSEALLDLQHFRPFEQRIILDGIEELLTLYDPGKETVEVLSIGVKRHNELFIRGRKVVI